MPLPDSFLDELKARSDITEIVSGYVSLKRRGKNMVGLCPFHNEKTPSFNIYPENGSFYCFGCGTGGDVITFIRRIENLDYMEAVRFLAQRAGLNVPEDQVDDGMARLRSRILEINRETARFYHRILMGEEGKAGLSYLTGRGLSLRTIRHFGLGFSPAGRFQLCDHLRGMGYSDEELITANVAFKSRSGRAMDRFNNRVMYPIIDLRGNVIAFGGRILTDEKPKYINTNDTPVYHKSNGLFAMNFAKNTDSGQLILAEGYMDVISLHQAGFTQAIASLGTSLTTEQARLISRYAKEVVICYDSDSAGQKATARAIPILREAGLLVRVMSVPDGKDPDEFIRSHGEEGRLRFQKLLDACGNDVEYQLQKLKSQQNIQTESGRVQYLNAAAEVLAGIQNPIERDVYAGRLAEEAGVERSSVLLLIRQLDRKREKIRRKQELRTAQQEVGAVKDRVNPEKKDHLRAAAAEEGLIAHLFSHPDDAENLRAKIPPEKFCTAFNRRVYGLLLEKIGKDRVLTLSDLSHDLTVEEISSVARILARRNDMPAIRQDVEEYIRVILQEGEKMGREDIQKASDEELVLQLQRIREQKNRRN
ncbi:MAG: DNA primase [Clostridia bacterium]|nr:DNA primase [Clostridia bacterium]MDY5559168.1 DNA primase [Candidatus Heritagella sp.]